MLPRQEVNHFIGPQPFETQALRQFTAADGNCQIQPESEDFV